MRGSMASMRIANRRPDPPSSPDSAGNLTTDTYSAAAVMRVYDAENRMTSETQANSYAAGTYSYDGDGRRVKRSVGVGGQSPIETWQVYGLGGELLAEYPLNGPAATPQKEYGYRNGQLLVTATVTSGWGAAPTLHDNPLVVNETTVQARHITELRDAINALRSHLNMSPYSWQYSVTTNDWITANPILEMRMALDLALGAPPSPGYATGLAQYEPVKAIHIQELRDRLLAAWTNGSSTQINWLVTDQLGTPRMVFDQTGSLANMSRHDYLPFGEEISAGVGGRTSAQGYTLGDKVRQKFTQKERDNETGLDYFSARYFGSAQGRFTGVDPSGIKQKHLINPQDLNRYTYVANNPLAFIDPNGAEKIKIIIRTFIPDKSVNIPGISTRDPTLPLPMRREFGGDDRDVGQHPERFRTQQIITLDTDPTKNRGCAAPLCLSSETKPGKTRELLEGGREKTGEADVSGMSARGVYPDTKSSDMIVVTATGYAHDPLVEGAPDLRYNLDIGLSYGKDGTLYGSVHGTKSEFPGIEIFVQRPEGNDKSEQLIQGYNPQDQGRGAWYILKTGEIDGGKRLKQ